MSELPKLPPTAGYVSDLANNASFFVDDEDDIGIAVYTRVQMLSFAREAMESGRRAGLEEAAKACEAETDLYPYADEDRYYNRAIKDCIKAIRALAEDSKA